MSGYKPLAFLLVISVSLLAQACFTRKTAQKSGSKDSPKNVTTAPAAEKNNLNNTNVEANPSTRTLPPPRWAPKRSTYKESYAKINDLIHTKLAVRFDWTKQYCYGQANLTLSPWFYPTDSLTLDAKGFTINKISLGGKDLKYTYDGSKIRITLDRTYKKDEKYEVFIDYIAKPNEIKEQASAAITGAKGLYFINPEGKTKGKPMQIWTQGETEASSCWFPTIDAPNERTTQEIAITVDKKFTTLSNGILVQQKENADGTRTDFWKQDLPHAPYLFAMAIGEFGITKDKWRNIDVSYYLEPEYHPYARTIFGDTPQMIEFFSKKLGYDYPWQKYAQVVVRDFVSGAMENTTCTIHYEDVQHDDRAHLDNDHQDIIAHELFHHWFGDLVTCESWANIPLNEAFATYGEYLWYEHRFGKDAADHHLDTDLQEYLAEATQKREPLIRYYYQRREDMFDGHSYQKGGRVLHMLRTILGDEAFFAGLQHYLKKNAFTDVEIDELRIALEDVCGQDLHWFFDAWFMQPGHPEIAVAYNYDESSKKVSVRIQQKQDLRYMPVYRLPVKIEVNQGGQRKYYPVVIQSLDTTFEFPCPAKPDNVVFDSDKYLLCALVEDKPLEWFAWQAVNGSNYKQRQVGIDALASDLEGKDFAINAIKKAIEDPFWALRLEAIQALDGYSGGHSESLISLIRKRAETDNTATVRAAAVQYLAQVRQDAELVTKEPWRKELITVFRKALKDSSYAVVGAALEAINESNDQEALAAARELMKTRCNAELRGKISNILMAHNAPEAYDFVMESLEKAGGLTKYYLIEQFGSYLGGLSDNVKEKGIEVLKDLAQNSGAYYHRLAAYKALKAYDDRADVKAFREHLRKTETHPQLIELYRSGL